MSSTSVVEAERLRIARELHDIVAHSFATINVRAGVEALGPIREISGEATRELRALLGLMPSAAPADASGRGLGGLQALADTMESAGLPTSVSVTGPRVALPSPVDRAAYGIVREALTNALRHAGRACASVSVTYAGDRLALEVVDDSRGGSANAAFGIAGMRERAQAVGGTLAAGPRPTQGFRVRASLPIGRRP